ncbi:MAG: hypothetical protein ABIK07_24110 [Planctomycetota bacterium]
MHKQIFLTFRLIAGLQRAVNVPRPVNPSVVNPLLPNHVSRTFIRINVSAHLLNHLAVVKLLLHAASLLADFVAGSRKTAAVQNQTATAVTMEMPAVLLLLKHVPHQLQKPAVLLLHKHVPHQLLKPAVLLLLRLVPHQLLSLAATKNLAATQILAKSQN